MDRKCSLHCFEILAIVCYSQLVQFGMTETRLDIVERLLRSEIYLLRTDLQNEKSTREVLANRLDEVIKQSEKPADGPQEHEHLDGRRELMCGTDICKENKLTSILKGIQEEKRIRQSQFDAMNTRILDLEQKLEDTRENVEFIRQNFTIFKETIGTFKAESIQVHATDARDCKDIQVKGIGATSGVYVVQVDVHGELLRLQVYCDMETDGGGWTVFQKRYDGSVDFYQNFKEYEEGFGSLEGEFWLGFKWIYHMTKNVQHELRIDIVDRATRKGFAKYSNFSVGEPPRYTLHVSGYSGTADDLLGKGGWHNGMAFTTKDRDQDNYQWRNCALLMRGGYWYHSCTSSNLNGKYQITKGEWKNKRFFWKNISLGLSASQMKFRKTS